MVYKRAYIANDSQNTSMSRPIGHFELPEQHRMKLSYQTVVILILMWLAGCSALSSKSEQSQPAEATQPQAVPAGEPLPTDDQIIENQGEFPEPANNLLSDLETDLSADHMYKLLVAEIAGQRGELGIAIKNYLEVAKDSHDPGVAARATQIAIFAKDQDAAMEAAQLWVDADPNNAEARRNLASVLLKVGNAVEAVAQFEKVIEIIEKDKGDNGQAFGIIAGQLAREPDRELAMAVMEQLLNKRMDNAEALFAFAHLAMRQARFDLSLSTLDKAIALKPQWSNAVILRARIMAMQGTRHEALNYLKGVTTTGALKNNLEVGITYARMLTEDRQFESALEEFIRLAKLNPRDSEINYYAGVLALQLNKLDVAQKYLEAVLQTGDRILETNYYLGQVAENRGKYDTALNRYSMVRRGEFYFNAQIRITAILIEQNLYDRAREHVQTIRTSNPQQKMQLLLLEGDILREAQRFQDAMHFYSDILQTMPNETSIRYARALVAEKLGELEMVENDLQTILQHEPKNAQVLNALGYTLADRTNRYEEALKYIQRAIELEPNDAAVVDSMGWVLYRLGDYSQSIKHLRRANELAKDPEIAAHLGEVLWVSGDKKGALEIWEASLKDNPKDETLLNVMKRFGL